MIMGTNSVLMPAFGPAPIPLINLILFYASPNPAPGVFDDFVKIPTLDVQGSGLPFGTASYSTLVIGGNVGADSSIGPRCVAYFGHTVSAHQYAGRSSTLTASLIIRSNSLIQFWARLLSVTRFL